MQPVQSVTIIGAGVVGCFLAYRLASEGVPVTVIERQHVGAGASGASAGNVQPGEVDVVLAAESLELFRHFLPAIKEESGIDPQDHEVHYLYAALDEQEVAQTQEFSTVLQQGGLRVEWIDGPTVRALESRFTPGVLGGAWHRDCMQMDAYRFVMALSKAMQGRGVQVRQGEVVGLQHSGERVTGVRLQDGTTLACDTLVLALGAWTGVAASQWLGVSLPIEPHSLQKLHVRPTAGPLRCAVRWSEVNVVSRVDGLVHVGSKHDPTGFTAQPTPEGRHWLLERLNTVLPAFEFEVVTAGAGLAASTPKKVPVLGPLPGFASAYVAVPSTNGFLLSAVLAHILTELFVRGRQHALLPDLLPERALRRVSTAE